MSLFHVTQFSILLLTASPEAESGSAALVAPDFAVTIATWITFFLLLFLLARFGWKPFVNALDEREAAVRDEVKRAENARREAEELLQQYELKLKNVQSEADAILNTSRQRAEEVGNKLETDARASAQQILEKAKLTIEGERQKAVSELKGIVANAASELTEKILKEELDMSRHEKLVEEVVSGIDRKRN